MTAQGSKPRIRLRRALTTHAEKHLLPQIRKGKNELSNNLSHATEIGEKGGEPVSYLTLRE